MSTFNVALIDEGASLSPGEAAVQLAATALAEYIDKYVVPIWTETLGSSIIVAQSGAVPAGYAQLILAPTTTEANSLGYHEETSDGFPVGIVELDACRLYNQPWTVTAAHELVELLINPKLDRFATVGDKYFPVEVADPVTGDSFAMSNGILVSNFSTPAYWGISVPSGGSGFDAMKLVAEPLPTIPHNGWLEWSEGGAYTSAYGPDLPPEMVRFMRTKEGRRRKLEQQHINKLWGEGIQSAKP